MTFIEFDVNWQFLMRMRQYATWQSFETELSRELEETFCTPGLASKLLTSTVIGTDGNGVSFRIDFHQMKMRPFATGEVGIIRRDTATYVAPPGELWECKENDSDWKPYDLASCKLLRIARGSGRISIVVHLSDDRETHSFEIDFELNQHVNRSTNKWHNIRLNTRCHVIPKFPGLFSESAKKLSQLDFEEVDVLTDNVELGNIVDGLQVNIQKIMKPYVEMRHMDGKNSVMENESYPDDNLLTKMPNLLQQLEVNSGDIKKVKNTAICTGGYAKVYKVKCNGKIMVAKSFTSNLMFNTGAAASQPQASKKPLRCLIGGEQHQQVKSMPISALTEKAPAAPAAAQVAPGTPLFTNLSPNSSPHHTATPPSPKTVLHKHGLFQGTAINQSPKDCPKTQAMRSAQLTKRPSAPLAKTEVVGTGPAQHLTASGGQSIRLSPREGQWQAQVTERIGHAHRQVVLPVVCAPDCQVAALLGYEARQVAQLLHVAEQGLDKFVYVGRQGLLGGMKPGVEEYKEIFSQGQSALRGSLLKLGPLKHQGPTAVEQAQSNIANLKEAIEEGHGLLLSLGTANSQVIEKLFSDLEQWLQEEQLCRPAAGDEGAQEYITRLREDGSLNWGGHRTKLTKLLERAYVQALKGAVSTSLLKGLSNEEQEKLAAALGQLAAFHQGQGSQTGDLSLYTDAAILYQHMLQVYEGEEVEFPGYQEQIKEAYRGLAEIKAAMTARCRQGKATLSCMVTSDELQDETARDKQILQDLRLDAKWRVAELEAAEMSNKALYYEESKALFAEIAQRVGAFLARLYQESEQELGPAPCKYAVMGLGSMALQQMTPYSDLEFAILIEEKESQEILEEYRAYFRELSHLVHLRVINLGETVLPRDQYKAQHNLQISLDHLGKRGINFDLGGKTPLGRSDKKLYDLIQSVSGMVRYLKNEDNKMEHIDKLLPFILERTCYVHGDQGLYEKYEQATKKFLQEGQTEQGAPVYQARALQKLLEGVVEMNYNKPGPGIVKPHQQGDLADFAPKFESGDTGRLYDVKQEIYRLPDRLLYRLAMYYGLLPESGWDAVAQLYRRGIIRREAAQHLSYAVSFATMLRLKTYLHQGQQGESMTVLGSNSQEAAQQFFVLSKEALQEEGSLFQYYYTALPLHEKMEEFFKGREGDLSPSQEENFFHKESFYNNSYSVRGHIHQRVMQHAAAKTCYKQALEMDRALYPGNHPDVAISLNNVGNAYQMLGEASKGLGYYEQALEMCRALYPGNHPDVANSLNNVGNTYQRLGESSKGLGYQEQALEMIQALYPGNHPSVAGYLNNVGSAYERLGEAKKGLGYKEQALQMYRALYPGNHPDVAIFLNNVGNAYQTLGEAKKGLGYQEHALQMCRALYPGNHPHVAISLNNMGMTYETLGEAKKGLGYLEQALEIMQAIYHGNHPHVAASLNSIGLAYQRLGEAKKGLGYQEQALKIRQALYPGNHPDVAASLNSVGSAYQRLGEAKKGLGYYEQALEMIQVLYPGNHPDVGDLLNNVGGAYQRLGEAKKGLGYQEKALDMIQALYPGNHPYVADSLNNVGMAYQRLGEASKGLGYYEQALEMSQALYPGNHPSVAMSLKSMGSAYETLGEAKKGLGYYEQALEMIQALYPGNHPYVADFLNNVGNAYHALGEIRKGLGYQEQALEMSQALYPGNHPSVAGFLNSVGSAYQRLGEAKKGLGYFQQALEMYRTFYPGNHPNVAMSLNNVGIAYKMLGEASKGLGYQEQALEMRQALYPGNHPDIAVSLNNVGNAYEMLGEAKKGLEYYEQALEMYRAFYPGNHPNVAMSLNNVGSAYKMLGEASKGLGYQEQALKMRQALYPGDHPDLAMSLHNVGMAYDMLGEASKGIRYQEQGLQMYRVLYPGNHPHVAAFLNNVGNAYQKLGEARKGLGYKEQALEMIQALYPGNHPNVASSLNNVGMAYQRLGEAKKGLGYSEQALKMMRVLYPCNHPDLAASLHNVGVAYQMLGEARKGLGYLEQALEMMRTVYPANHPSIQQIEQNLRKLSTQQVGESDLFFQACMAGNDSLAASMSIGSLKKDLKDTQGNPLICWMAQHEMVSTIERALSLSWNPNLPNINQVYPLHYGAVKNLPLTRLLLQGGAHPYVQTAKGNTPAQAARNKGKVDTLNLLLPPLGELSYTDAASFEGSYQAYKQGFSQCQLNTEELLAALDVGLQLGDAELVQAVQARESPHTLLGQLMDRYPLATAAIQERLSGLSNNGTSSRSC